jgi:hypothetical protein
MIFLMSFSITLAQDICESDFNCDGNVDASDVSTFLEDFGRSQFFNPCPPCVPPVILPKTGQTNCYDTDGNPRDCAGTGEDGEYQLGYERFVDSGDGTVKDNFTGLMWLNEGNCIATHYPSFDNDGIAGDGWVSWQHALDFVVGINDGTYPLCGAGYTNWRLPNAQELNTLKDISPSHPTIPINNPFVSLISYYWASTTVWDIPTSAWFINGFSMTHDNKAHFVGLLPVRGGH